MKTRLFKTVLILIATIGILLGALSIGVVTLVDPNQFKDILQTKTLEQTGRVLTINGPIRWRLWPVLSLEAEDLKLANAPGFNHDFLSAKKVWVQTEIWPLFLGKFLFTTEFQNITLTLERNASGLNNWSDLQDKLSKQPKSTSLLSIQWLPNGIRIDNGHVFYHDESSRKHYAFNRVKLSAENLFKGVVGIANPVDLSFQVEDLQEKPMGDFSLRGLWTLNAQSHQIDIQKLILKTELPNQKPITITGNIQIKNVDTSPLIEGSLESTDWELPLSNPITVHAKALFKYQAPWLDIASTVDLKNIGTLASSFKIDPMSVTLKTLNMDGNFTAQELQIGALKVDNLNGKFTAKGGIITLNPVEMHVAKGQQTLSLQLDARNDIPQYTLTQEGNGLVIQDILSVMGKKEVLDGLARLKTTLTAKGNTPEEWRKSLSGQASIEVTQGKFYGVDLVPKLKQTQSALYALLFALSHQQPKDIGQAIKEGINDWKENAPKGSFTPFDSLNASLNIQNGIINNDKLTLLHSQYTLEGQGSINLNNETLQYKVMALLKDSPLTTNDDLSAYLKQTAIPIQIKGALTDPAIRPDVETYTKNALKYTQKNVVEKFVNKTLNHLLEKALQ